MNAVGWVAVAYIVTNGTVQITRAGLSYRTQKRNAELRAAKGTTNG